METDRIRLFQTPSLAGLDVIFVNHAVANVRDKTFPDTGTIPAQRQRVFSPGPAVEIADHTHTLGIGSPDSKKNAPDTVLFDQMRAQLFI